ncbi:tocopherol cyclase [Chloropicon primus]|uniref:Tocopherol cyclase n=1 Tax=Chloropicon primus TaxID=1764295 RepID=A0A5B8MED9_9CHLO|nr:tocopherol cyclase [Chloropicon primus]UPQ97240.1 tocopherol cyclase [Chloropicon primus]|eukprot:QDZ18025.1 tocopherol cyclase [Chloropicon primus]
MRLGPPKAGPRDRLWLGQSRGFGRPERGVRRGADGCACLPSFSSDAETPHSGYHWDGNRGRFMEGWYFKVATGGGSFAFMYSIENPNSLEPPAGLGAQVMGPEDTYTVQYTRDTRRFWASRDKLELGGAFRLAKGVAEYPSGMVGEGEFAGRVERGFQVSSTWHQGHLSLESQGVGGYIEPGVKECSWAYKTARVHGWGNSAGRQIATAGLLAALPVFEPHWQILMSYGLSTGWIKWGSKTYEFENAPSYSEKNWGEGFPKRWFWIQCNTFGDKECTSLTAGGGRRTLPFLLGQDEDVALIGIHHKGRFIEIVPWNGEVSWNVSPWGSWVIKGKTKGFSVELEAKTSSPGTVLRAPTVEGLIPVCKDTFEGSLTMKVWENGTLIIDRTSDSAALEVGGGPWWDTWVGDAEMKEPLRSLTSGLTDVEAPLC